jgi:hypothetical protein
LAWLPRHRRRQNAIQGNVYVKNITFDYKLPPHPQPIPFTVTSVLGHVNASDFGERYKSWRSCDPFDLFDAEIVESIGDVRPLLSSWADGSSRAAAPLVWPHLVLPPLPRDAEDEGRRW